MNCPRLAAARCLAAVIGEGKSLSRQLPVSEAALADNQRALYREFCYGTLRQYWRLQAGVEGLFAKPLKARDLDVKILVYIGVYQLLHTRVPPHAAINSCVEGCRSLRKQWAAGMVNALLRRCQREADTLFTGLDPASASAHPQWLYQALRGDWPEQFEAILQANNGHPPMCLRVNTLRGSRADYLQRLSEADIAASPCDFAGQGIRLHSACGVDQLPGFFAGDVSVQDEAAQLCCELLDLQPGQRVLDSCAAPGGKTAALLEHCPALGELLALDIDAQRLERVAENLARLDLNAQLVPADALDTATWWDGKAFDRILLDAPCSATGVIRRHPDIKIHRKARDIDALCALQANMLDTLWACLAPGGLLLYATCSVLQRENRETIATFLDRHADAEAIAIDADWGEASGAGRQLLPRAESHDGFFYARLQKASS